MNHNDILWLKKLLTDFDKESVENGYGRTDLHSNQYNFVSGIRWCFEKLETFIIEQMRYDMKDGVKAPTIEISGVDHQTKFWMVYIVGGPHSPIKQYYSYADAQRALEAMVGKYCKSGYILASVALCEPVANVEWKPVS